MLRPKNQNWQQATASAYRLPFAQGGDRPHEAQVIRGSGEVHPVSERPDRANWQKPDEVVKALGLKGSETVVDLGFGSGYFTFRLAKVLPNGESSLPTPSPR